MHRNMQMPMKGHNSCTALRCKFRLQSMVRNRAKRKPFAKSCLICEYQWKTDELIKEVRDWRILQRLNVITTNEALIWLFHLGFAAPFQWDLISSQLSKYGMTFDDAFSIFKKLKHIRCTEEHKHDIGMLQMMVFDSMSFYTSGSCTEFRRLFRYLSSLNHPLNPLTLHQCGFYYQSMDSSTRYQGNHNPREYFQMAAINFFFLEDYQQTVTHCIEYHPFVNCPAFVNQTWIDNVLHGICTFSLIKLGNRNKAKTFLKFGMKCKQFIHNPIINFCAEELGLDKVIRKKEFCPMDHDVHADICCLFQGMILQCHYEAYREALVCYRYSQNFGAHPIGYYRLYECYLAIGLYRRSLRCLKRAVKWAEGDIPSIAENMDGKKEAVRSLLNALICDQCGAQMDETQQTVLCPCSGCLEVWYCNRRCQKMAWKRSHRLECSGDFEGLKRALQKQLRFRVDGSALSGK